VDVPEGQLVEGRVDLPSGRDASALFSKGNHGTPKTGGALELTLVEAAYLVEAGRLRVVSGGHAVSLSALLTQGGAADDRFEVRYLVYREFRERGYVVREEPPSAKIDFSVRPRGAQAKAPSSMWVQAFSERGSFSAGEAYSYVVRASGLGKQAILAVADEEGDITFYELAVGLPKGKAKPAPGETVRATLVGDRALLEGEAAEALGASEEMFGKPLKEMLRLSLIETAYLVEERRLTVAHKGKESVPAKELVEMGTERHPDFALRLSAYRDLRHLGLLPKTGFKYGSDFRVYDRESGSPHARFLVHAVPSSHASSWSELARAVRLAHGVRKRLVLALVSPNQSVQYLHVSWARP
jgi:tRNA-intron endonuclease, archaea type